MIFILLLIVISILGFHTRNFNLQLLLSFQRFLNTLIGARNMIEVPLFDYDLRAMRKDPYSLGTRACTHD